jgi:hypothetical protein
MTDSVKCATLPLRKDFWVDVSAIKNEPSTVVSGLLRCKVMFLNLSSPELLNLASRAKSRDLLLAGICCG